MSDSHLPQSLSKAVKEARVALGLSQEDLANLAGISRRPIYLLEKGSGGVRVETLLKVLDALGLTFSIHPKRATID